MNGSSWSTNKVHTFVIVSLLVLSFAAAGTVAPR